MKKTKRNQGISLAKISGGTVIPTTVTEKDRGESKAQFVGNVGNLMVYENPTWGDVPSFVKAAVRGEEE